MAAAIKLIPAEAERRSGRKAAKDEQRPGTGRIIKV